MNESPAEPLNLDFLTDLAPDLQAKGRKLFKILGDMQSLVVAFSGGVDSGLLCAAGYRVLGDHLLAVTVRSPVETANGNEAAAIQAAQVGFHHQVVDFDDLHNPAFVANPPDRCYHCKLGRFRAILVIARETGACFVAEGSNMDDIDDYRPGTRAVAELGIRSPLIEAGLNKSDIRALAKAMGLSVWDRPSAPCLATRFPYGTPVTPEGLLQIMQGEAFLREKGFRPVRVRHFGDTARLEVSSNAMAALMAVRDETLAYFRGLGFTYVVVDLAGYRSGSMNEVLKK